MKRGIPLLTIAQIRTLEQQFFAQGYTSVQLMQQAGQAAFLALQKAYPTAGSVSVVCGAGFNGGDGLVLASHAQKAGLDVSIYMMMDRTLTGSMKEIQEQCLAQGLVIKPYHHQAFQGEVIVDALLGIGFHGKPEGHYAQAILAMQSAKVPIVSIDVPSGIDADTGAAPGIAVSASMTVSFLAHKRGLYTGAALDHVGTCILETLGAQRYYHLLEPTCFLLDTENVASIEKRKANAHKGDYGFVTVIGGDVGFGGAACLAGTAALVSGAGCVQLLTHSQHQTAFLGSKPELMVRGLESGASCERLLSRSTVLVVGPGLGTSTWSKSLWGFIEEQTLPCVIDADGLNLLAGSPQSRDTWILTPHSKEAARLLDGTVDELCADRFAAVSKLQKRYGGVVVLKGAGTLVTDGHYTWCCPLGNPGMATAGAGDVLAGLIGGLLAQGLSFVDAAIRGVWVHAKAGDSAAQRGERGVCAQDILAHIREHNQS